MSSVTAKTVTKGYLVLVLLLAVFVSPLPQLGLALVLLAVQLFLVYKSVKANLELALVVASLVFVPLALVSLVGEGFSVLLIVPGLFLLDQSLRKAAVGPCFEGGKVGRRLTSVMKTLLLSLFLVLVASVLLVNFTLLLTALVLVGYLLGVVWYFVFRVPRAPFGHSNTWSRVVVGDTGESKTSLKSKAGVPVFVSLRALCSWVSILPENLVLPVRGEVGVGLRFVPPLAGPSKVAVEAVAVDERGLVQVSQVLELVDLHIIPRAKYARWLADKYLEQTAAGVGLAAPVASHRVQRAAKSGVEYLGSREFQAGDRWKDMDWKHTFRFGELIVKEFAGAQGQRAVLLADLTARDAEEADRVAYDFVMSALTLALEGVPTALAVYNAIEVLTVSAPSGAREVLKRVLMLTGQIVQVEGSEHVLEASSFSRIRRMARQLEGSDRAGAKVMAGVLRFEQEASEAAVGGHPVGQVLDRLLEFVEPPAVFTVVSGFDEGGVLGLSLERLKGLGYSVVRAEH